MTGRLPAIVYHRYPCKPEMSVSLSRLSAVPIVELSASRHSLLLYLFSLSLTAPSSGLSILITGSAAPCYASLYPHPAPLGLGSLYRPQCPLPLIYRTRTHARTYTHTDTRTQLCSLSLYLAFFFSLCSFLWSALGVFLSPLAISLLLYIFVFVSLLYGNKKQRKFLKGSLNISSANCRGNNNESYF